MSSLTDCRLSPHFVPKVLGNMAAGHVSMRHGLRGPNLAPACAGAAGAQAIGDAFSLIRDGTADVMLAGNVPFTGQVGKVKNIMQSCRSPVMLSQLYTLPY